MTTRPEILAPAGDWASLRAALAAGADAVYFGLDEGFNARARAKNFGLDDLEDLTRACRRAGARSYLTVNTLVFEVELGELQALLRAVARAGVDALIVQDPATALVARAVCPALELHASTQMTISSAEAVRLAERLGMSRVVLPRELSIDQIRHVRARTGVELEVFVHGALCMSWSGQCLTSETWGGRSANRGQCAQSCRLPYELVVDGERKRVGAEDLRYLLSPRDLAAHRAVPDLMALGVHTFKIEGRLKGPAYVFNAVTTMRRWVDAILRGEADDAGARARLADDLGQAHRIYSRGFTDGFFFGGDHQTLVDGRFPKHRGQRLGTVVEVRGTDVVVARVVEGGPGPAEAPIEPLPGIGVGFDAGDPEARDEGGPVFAVAPEARGWILSFARRDRGGPDLSRVRPGQRVWATGDPQAERLAERASAAAVEGRVPLRLTIVGRVGEPLVATMEAACGTAEGRTTSALSAATGAGLTAELVADKLGALGGTPFRLEGIDARGLAPGAFVAPGELKALRRALVAELEAALDRGPARVVRDDDVIAELRARVGAAIGDAVEAGGAAAAPATRAMIIPLCRTDAQLDAVIAAGLPEVELDWMELVGLGHAVARAKAAGLRVTLATTRVQKPGEEGIDRRLLKLAPDALLVRHWGGLVAFAEGFAPDDAGAAAPRIVHGDFSLNVTNSLTGNLLLSLGLTTVTASHDLDERQLFGLVGAMPRGRVAVVVHHHIPTFHTEHCVYAHTLSTGRDYTTCGRPCERHEVALVDPLGLAHPVITDVGCRNTVFEARAQSAAALVPRLVEAGVRRLRVELVRESAAETKVVLDAYRALIAGAASAREVTRAVGAHEQYGVMRGVAASARAG
ncbi:MAG: U32 family peptidase [Deltaproteobacteria bacterium]|nr:U32 family peptidase [Deltaproteobacteria bacterium]